MDAQWQELEKGLAAISDYDDLRRSEDEDLEKLKKSLKDIVPELDRLSVEHETHVKSTKGRFNLFTVLLGIGDETRLHSRWLAHLLDPQGAHDCGPLFLRLFVQMLRRGVQQHADDDKLDKQLENFNFESARTEKEKETQSGRIDILIHSNNGLIAIENKIWAAEQTCQISRYGDYLQTEPCGKTAVTNHFFFAPQGRSNSPARLPK